MPSIRQDLDDWLSVPLSHHVLQDGLHEVGASNLADKIASVLEGICPGDGNSVSALWV